MFHAQTRERLNKLRIMVVFWITIAPDEFIFHMLSRSPKTLHACSGPLTDVAKESVLGPYPSIRSDGMFADISYLLSSRLAASRATSISALCGAVFPGTSTRIDFAKSSRITILLFLSTLVIYCVYLELLGVVGLDTAIMGYVMEEFVNPTNWGEEEGKFESLVYIEGSKTPAQHTVDVWTPPAPILASPKKFWVMYVAPYSQLFAQTNTHSFIHGGAWYDPLTDQRAFRPIATALLSSPSLSKIAGMASINYRLSPYPSHPTHPSSPDDPNRNAKHPDHLNDVMSALAFLNAKYTIGSNYLLLGHSCGATLTFQVDCRRWQPVGDKILSFRQPLGMLGLSGIYDLNAMVAYHDPTMSEYRNFTTGAYGADEEEWKLVSPTDVRGLSAWMAAKVVGLAHSEDDGLVEMEQVELMQAAMKKVDGSAFRGPGAETERKDLFVALQGWHDSIWGEAKATPVIEKMLEELTME
jgi:kynurenine formamidase